MSPSETARGTKRWRNYISQAILQGRKQDAGSVARVSAPEIETKVLEAVRAAMGDPGIPAETVREVLDKITIGQADLSIRWTDTRAAEATTRSISVPWSPTRTRRQREILQGDGAIRSDPRPMRIEARRAIIAAYGKARSWLDQLVADPAISIATLASDEGRTERSIRQTLSLAFLDPAIVKAAIERTLPRGLGLTRLMDLPPIWPQQWTTLGLETPAHA
jgi:site-specific DNA recombinase